MPRLIPTRKFLKDLDVFNANAAVRKKIAKALSSLEKNPQHPGLHLERIINDPVAWSVRVDRKYRISFEFEDSQYPGNPDWSESLILLRIPNHDDLYKYPR